MRRRHGCAFYAGLSVPTFPFCTHPAPFPQFCCLAGSCIWMGNLYHFHMSLLLAMCNSERPFLAGDPAFMLGNPAPTSSLCWFSFFVGRRGGRKEMMSARAAITKYIDGVFWTIEIYSPTLLEARKSKIKGLAGFGSWWELSSWLANSCLLLCFLSLFYKDISPTGLGPNPYDLS